MRHLLMLALLACALVAAAPSAESAHRGDDPLDEAFLPAIVHLEPGERMQVELVLRNADTREVEATLRPYLSEGTGVALRQVGGGTVSIPGLVGIVRVPFEVIAPRDLEPGVYTAMVEVSHAKGSEDVPLRVAVASPDADLPAPVLEGEPRLAARNGTSASTTINVTNAADIPRAVHVGLSGVGGWNVQESDLIVLPAGQTRNIRLTATPHADAPDAQVAEVVVREHERPLARMPVPLEVTDRTPLLEVQIEPHALHVPLNGSATATLTVRNPADVPQTARLALRWPLSEGFASDLPDDPFELPPGGELQLQVTIRDTHGLPHTAQGAIEALQDDGTHVGASWTLHTGDAAAIDAGTGARSEGTTVPMTTVGAGALALVGTGALGIAVVHRRWPLLFAAFYARVRPSKALEQPIRRALVDIIRAHRGIAWSDAQRLVALANGQMEHHVRQLQRADIIRVTRDGSLRRLTLTDQGPALRENLAERALAHLQVQGSATASDVAHALGISRQLAHHHLRRLEAAGAVEVRIERGRLVVRAAD